MKLDGVAASTLTTAAPVSATPIRGGRSPPNLSTAELSFLDGAR